MINLKNLSPSHKPVDFTFYYLLLPKKNVNKIIPFMQIFLKPKMFGGIDSGIGNCWLGS